MKKRLVFNLLMTTIWIGCTPLGISRKKTHETGNVEDTSAVQQTRYEPSRPVQTTFLDTLNRGNEISLDNSAFQKESVPVSEVVVEQTEASIRYKIQLFASSQIETIREQKRNMESKIDIPLSISFESPYYKLLAGNFAQRAEAEQHLKKIKSLGYNDAWIISSKAGSN
ncbi:MAG TPA: SPOR domain-containing protein [Chitinispirillaceae bacterium]|nr:SPOR domain-containing protein [Chitinispirillaceae bacterium]